ncbi:DUF5348 domain-containing protein [Cohnella yongneupensis]|uniref:DUF5348 domain-containing protein n=1 Tax=Cohnella yongneupensis TaxID=425006 RepID=A0ABW0R6P1_9BACL
MRRNWLQMSYDKEGDRWAVDMGNGHYALRCGNFLEIRIGDSGVPCRLELDRDWYVVMQEARFYLRKKDTYQVEI